MKTLNHKKTINRLNAPLFVLMAANFIAAKRNFSAINEFINHLNPNRSNYWNGENLDFSLEIMIKFIEVKEERKIEKLTDSAYSASNIKSKNKAVKKLINEWRRILSSS